MPNTLSKALWRLATVLLFLLLCRDTAVLAQAPDDERGRVHFEAGESYFKAERWDQAAREFSQAYELSGRPEMLINLSRAHERDGQLSEAVADLERLLERHPQTAYKDEAEQRLSHMRSQLASAAHTNVRAQVAQPSAQSARASSREPKAEATRWPPRWPTLAVGGTAVAAAVVALTTGLLAHSRYGELERKCPEGECRPSFADEREHGQRLARTSTGFTFAALALGGATAALWLWDFHVAKDRARLGLHLHGARAEARLRLDF